MRRDPARPAGPVGRLCFAQGPGYYSPRPDRNIGRPAGMREPALSHVQLRSSDGRNRSSEP